MQSSHGMIAAKVIVPTFYLRFYVLSRYTRFCPSQIDRIILQGIAEIDTFLIIVFVLRCRTLSVRCYRLAEGAYSWNFDLSCRSIIDIIDKFPITVRVPFTHARRSSRQHINTHRAFCGALIGGVGGVAGPVQRPAHQWNGDCDQNRNDCDHAQHLHQGKAGLVPCPGTSFSVPSHLLIPPFSNR